MFLHGFRFLSSASALGFQLLSFCFFLSSFPLFQPHSWLLQLLGSVFTSPFSSSFLPGFPCIPSDSKYLAFCLFPFVLPCFTPTAVPQVLPFQISPPGPMPDFRFLSSASILASHYSAICSSFSTFFPFLPHRGLSRCSCSALASQVFPLIPGLVSRAFFPVLCTRLSVSFLSPFPVSLPQLLDRCLPDDVPLSVLFVLAFFPSIPLPFVRFISGSGYSAFRFFLSLLPCIPSRWFLRCRFPRSLSSVSIRPFPLPVLSFPAFPFSVPLLRPTGATSAAGLLFPARPFPLAFAVGSGYLAWVIHPEN